MPRLLASPALLMLLAACSGGDTEVKVADDPPEITVISPLEGASFDPLVAVQFCLSVSDNSPDDTMRLVAQSSVDGTIWSHDIDTEPVACEGGNFGFEATLSDDDHGITFTVTDPADQVGTATLNLLRTDNSAPFCEVLTPLDAEAFEAGTVVAFSAHAEDAEESAEELTAVLQSDVEGELYSGSPDSAGSVNTSLTALTPGYHALTLTITDPRGLVGACATTIYMNDCTDWDNDGFTTCNDDCDDDDDTVYPGAEDIIDGKDNDCDGITDEGAPYVDDDGDGYAETDGDCNDGDTSINPGEVETYYDGVDVDCDELSDYDADQDGFDSSDYGGTDCDDTDAAIYPAAPDAWYDGVDSNCAGDDDFDADTDGFDSADYGGDDCDDTDATINLDAAENWYDGIDQDCDALSDYDRDGDGYDYDLYGGDDCDDGDVAINPLGTETPYDGIDQDCTGADWTDVDGDSYDSDIVGGSDCDDDDAAINIDATETWYDGVDQDCAGDDDYDQDKDSYVHDAYGGSDCDDEDIAINPAATDDWYDGIDANCDDWSDYDQDLDGHDSDA